jgi:hypothetical protein
MQPAYMQISERTPPPLRWSSRSKISLPAVLSALFAVVLLCMMAADQAVEKNNSGLLTSLQQSPWENIGSNVNGISFLLLYTFDLLPRLICNFDSGGDLNHFTDAIPFCFLQGDCRCDTGGDCNCMNRVCKGNPVETVLRLSSLGEGHE